MMPSFDHAYTDDPGHAFWTRMKRLGFTPRESEVEHPGGQFCRFVAFPDPKGSRPVYLEFIDARDPKHPVNRPGLSFRFERDLEKASRGLSARGLEVEFLHKNYDWKQDSRSRLPGWNFVSFKRLGFRSLFPWITEYEPSPKRKVFRAAAHPNGVRHLLALEFEINEAGRAFFAKLFGRKIGSSLKVAGGRTFYFREGRTTRLTAIVLEARSLKRVLTYPVDETTTWRDRPAAVVHNPAGQWNLVIV